MNNYLKFFINGDWVLSDGGRKIDVLNPSTEQPVSQVMLGSEIDVDKAVTAARAAFPAFSATSAAQRCLLLERIVAGYQRRMPDLARAISDEMG